MGREKAREGDHHLTWYLTRDEKYTVHSTSVFSSLRSLATIGPQRNISIDDNGTRHASVKKTNETVRDPRSVNYSVNFTVEQLIDPGKGSAFLVVPLLDIRGEEGVKFGKEVEEESVLEILFTLIWMRERSFFLEIGFLTQKNRENLCQILTNLSSCFRWIFWSRCVKRNSLFNNTLFNNPIVQRELIFTMLSRCWTTWRYEGLS